MEHVHEGDPPVPGGGETILFVDDEPALAKLGMRHLQAMGYDALALTDPAEALQLVKEEPERFDLLISDMAMPKIPGDQLAAEILTIRPDMPIILCTGYSSSMSDERAAEMGVRAYLHKPMSRSELAEKVREVLAS